ncbi:MAG: WecB/TagA/CpsF family glycosyltransferase [Planctomycetota bacterium]
MSSSFIDSVSSHPVETPVVTAGVQWPTRKRVIGVDVSDVDYDQAVDCILSAARAGQRGVVACHAVHAIVTASGDQELRSSVNRFEMVTPDGQPVRWAMNWLHGTRLKERVYGPELTLRVCRAAAEQQVPIYLYGGTPEILIQLESQLQELAPGLTIAGSESPPFRPLSEEENQEACDRINQSGAKILLIGLGCPKQDWFAAKNAETINAIQMCVGAAFDFHAGVKPMAPQWMQRHGLEWLFRLLCEPRRLWKRYLVTNTVFCGKVASQLVGQLFSRRGASPA